MRTALLVLGVAIGAVPFLLAQRNRPAVTPEPAPVAWEAVALVDGKATLIDGDTCVAFFDVIGEDTGGGAMVTARHDRQQDRILIRSQVGSGSVVDGQTFETRRTEEWSIALDVLPRTITVDMDGPVRITFVRRPIGGISRR